MQEPQSEQQRDALTRQFPFFWICFFFSRFPCFWGAFFLSFARPLKVNGPFRGAVFHHDGVPENSPLALRGRFPSLMGRFLTFMGRSPNALMARFPLENSLETAH